MNNQSANANPRQRARDVVLLTAAAICSWRLAKIVASPGLQLDVIPTLVVLGRKHFKHVKPEAEHEPKHPAVKFILDVWNQGDFSEAEKYVAPDLAMSINGFVYESTPEDRRARAGARKR